MADNAGSAEERRQRSAALEEKRRRLEELKKRRVKRGEDTAKVKAALGGTHNLDDYIDGLLATQPPAGAVSAAGGKADGDKSSSDDAAAAAAAVGDSSGGVKLSGSGDNDDNRPVVASAAVAPAPPPPTKSVETFTIGTQTEDEDFPESPATRADEEEDEDAKLDQSNLLDAASAAAPNLVPPEDEDEDDEEAKKSWKLLSAEEAGKELSASVDAAQSFSTFVDTASKKVERVLGNPILSNLMMDMYYASPLDDDEVDRTTKGGADNESRFVSSRQIFQCPTWTSGRDVTDVDWSPHHRELFLSTYNHQHRRSSSSYANSDTAVSVVSSTMDTRSSSLTPRTSGELQSDGLLLLWNLTMPNRPEHVFTCGSSVTSGKFHPNETSVVLGGCHSGQLVLWDVRAGRLPVQKSALACSVPAAAATSAAASKRGHVYPIDGMNIIEGGLGLVTSSSDGRVNFWSLSNLREPVESIQVSDSVSCLCVAPETEALLLGDENGNIFTAQPPSSQAATAADSTSSTTPVKSNSAGKGGGGSGGGSTGGAAVGGGASASGRATRRTIRKLDTADESGENFGHYGMVTSISAKMLKRNATSRAAGLTRGFLRGSGGLVLSSGVDWTVKLWAPAYSDAPILSTVSHSYDYMSDVQWCPNHPSLFATASCSGTVGLWNLATSLEEPITGTDGLVLVGDAAAAAAQQNEEQQQQKQQVGLNRLRWSGDGRRLAVASADVVHLLSLTEDTVRPKSDDEAKMMNQLASRGLIGASGVGTAGGSDAAVSSESRQ